MNQDKKKKKIVYLLEYPIDLPGGAQMSTESLCDGLVSSEFESVVICPKLLKKSVADYPFRVVTYPMGEKRIPNLFIRLFAFGRILKTEKPDIVHIQMPESLITYGMLPPWRRKAHLIFTDRGLFTGYRSHSLLLMKYALKHANLMLTTTKLNKKLWEEGTSIHPILRVANTISDRFLAYDEKKKEHEGFVLGFAGRICEEKNWPLVNKICRMCKEAGISFRVSLVLSLFEKNDQNEVDRLIEGLYHDIGMENVEYHLDYNQDQMASYYYGVDIFVMTSRFESFGKAAVEAMSRKCAVIATSVGGLKEVIEKDENLYTEDTPEKAVAYIKKMAEHPEKLKEDQDYFFHRYQNEFTQEKCLMDHLEIYRKILNE